MKNKFLFLAILSIFSYSIVANATTDPTILQNISKVAPMPDEGNLVAGGGYSDDSQQIAPVVCYNAKIGSVSQANSYISLDTAMSFSDLQKMIKFDVSSKGKFGMFSASAEASYLHEMEDKTYSLSLNYYEYANANTSVQPNGYGVKALNDLGKSYYKHRKNGLFNLMCGDNFISSYEVGAMLTMGININFKSHYEKEDFEAKTGGSFGDIFSASAQVQKIATQYNMQGTVSINAYQAGGDPAQLSGILKKDSSGKYYVLTCDLQHMDNCVQAASGLLDYANQKFPTQFSFTKGIGLTPLGLGFSKYEPISYIGLKTPKSLVTPQVQQDRLKLANDLLANKYYQQKFTELLYGYPVPWDKQSKLYQNMQNMYARAHNNIGVIMSTDNPEQGALACYDHPDECDAVTKNIESKSRPITNGDLGFLGLIKDIVPTVGGIWYPITDDNTQFISPSSNGEHSTIKLDDTNMYVDVVSNWCQIWGHTTGHLTGKYPQYSGILGCYDHNGKRWEHPNNVIVKSNPYYFEAYKPTNP